MSQVFTGVWVVALMLVATAARAQEGEVERRDDGGLWFMELGINAEPVQTYDAACNRRTDCVTRSKAYFGGALRGVYRDPEVWSLTATVGLTTFVDQEERPPSYTALTTRIDAQLELGRTRDHFGIALRLSPVLIVGWGNGATDVLSDFPGVGLTLGTTRLWGELGLRTLPTPSDPRGFYLAFGFALSRWSGTAGIGTFGTLGFYDDHIATPGAQLGGYADIAWRVTAQFDMRLMAVVASPILLSLGFGWHFSGAE